MTDLNYESVTKFMERGGYNVYDDDDVMDAIVDMSFDDEHFTDDQLQKMLAAFRYAEFMVKYGHILLA